jgi:hypothetical protein
MGMSERERVLSKLDKILARAKSANVHEAETARRMADELMVKHGLTDADLERHHESGYHEVSLGYAGFNTSWKFALVTAAARYSGCEAVALQSGRRRKVRLVGEKAAVEKAVVFFNDLLKTLTDLERREGERLVTVLDYVDADKGPRECADSFRRGAVASIINKLNLTRPGRFGRKNRSGRRPSGGSDVTASGIDVASKVGKIWTTVKALVLGDKRAEHAEKIKEKYAPRMRPIDLEDAASPDWYWLGYDAADRQVVIRDDEPTDGKVSGDSAKAGG